MTKYTYIDQQEQLEKAVLQVGSPALLALDIEGEFNLHRYGMHLCLIQIYDGDKTLLIDPLTIKDLSPVWKWLEDPAILKISHGVQSDLTLLDMLFGLRPRNFFDTQRAAMLLGYETTSLKGILAQHFGIVKNEKVREMDWHTRPLTIQMLEYAADDVTSLPELYARISKELHEKGRWEWMEEENKMLEEIRFVPKTDPHLNLKGANILPTNAKKMLMGLYAIRERIASELNRPPNYVISNGRLVELSQDPPDSVADWVSLSGVHPAVKKNALEFSEAVKEGKLPLVKSNEPFVPKNGELSLSRLTPAERKIYEEKKEKLSKIRDRVEERYPDIHLLILSQKAVHKLAIGVEPEFLRRWQTGIIREYAKELNLNLEGIV